MAALNAEIPDDLKRRLAHAVTDRDTTLKVAIGEAIELWIAGAVAPALSVPKGIPEDQSALVWRFLDAYNNDPIFKSVVDGILVLRSRK